MRIFLFKLIYKLAVWVFPCGARSALVSKYCEDQIDLYQRDKAMAACVRPRTTPQPKESKAKMRYTDYYERANYK